MKKRNDLLLYFLMAFGWMWLLNLPRVLANFGLISIPFLLSEILKYLAMFAPAVSAFILTISRFGREGAQRLWKSGWNSRVPRKYLLAAGLLVPVSGLATAGLMYVFGTSVPWEYSLPPMMVVPIALLIWLFGAYPEEYGWRGFALPRLLERRGALLSSLILGVVWAFWHLPLFFIEGTTQQVIPFWQYLLQTVELTVIYTWLYQGTGGSVLTASLFHAAGNITGALIPYWVSNEGRWISFLVMLIPAACVIHYWMSHGKDSPGKIEV